MDTAVVERGYFSVLRWVKDPIRDEAKNLAVVLVEPEGRFGGIKAAPLASVAPRLGSKGLVDAIIGSIEQRFTEPQKPTLGDLRELHESLVRSLQLTQPKPTAVVGDVDKTLNALYKAYVSVPGGGGQGVTKGRLKGRLFRAFESQGATVQRDRYVGDFFVDLWLSVHGRPIVSEVFSFGNPTADWIETEREAGHFLFGLARSRVGGFGIAEPPNELSKVDAHKAHERICRWFEEEKVPLFPASMALKDPEGILQKV